MRKEMKDHRLFEVRLIVAVPDYGTGTFDALDAIVPFIDEEVTVLDMESTQLFLTTEKVKATTPVVTVNTSTTTTPIAVTNVVTTTAKTPAKKAEKKAKATQRKRKTVKAKNASKRWTEDETLQVWQLREQGVSHAEIAKILGRSRKSVADHYSVTTKGK